MEGIEVAIAREIQNRRRYEKELRKLQHLLADLDDAENQLRAYELETRIAAIDDWFSILPSKEAAALRHLYLGIRNEAYEFPGCEGRAVRMIAKYLQQEGEASFLR